MFVSATVLVARYSQRAFYLLAALTLSGLRFLAVAVGAVHESAGMAGVDEGSAHLVMADAEPMSLTPDVPRAMASVTGEERSPTGSGCEGMCASPTADKCTIVAALTVPTLLALLLGRRRDTFLGLMSRTARTTHRRRWGDRWRHPAPSLTALCVLRV